MRSWTWCSRGQTKNSECVLKLHEINVWYSNVGWARTESCSSLYKSYQRCFTFGVAYFKGQILKEQLCWGLGTMSRWLKTKLDTAQEAHNWGSLVRTLLSFTLNHPTNKHVHEQTAPPSWVSVFLEMESVSFLEQALVFLACHIPTQLQKQLVHLGFTLPSITPLNHPPPPHTGCFF